MKAHFLQILNLTGRCAVYLGLSGSGTYRSFRNGFGQRRSYFVEPRPFWIAFCRTLASKSTSGKRKAYVRACQYRSGWKFFGVRGGVPGKVHIALIGG